MHIPKTAHVTDDSRQVKQGSIFIHDVNNHPEGEAVAIRFIKQAKQNGASEIVTNIKVPDTTFNPAPNKILAKWAAQKFPAAPKILVGVTGTNGKTSVAWFYRQLANAQNHPCGSIGTLGVYNHKQETTQTGYTTPTAPVLHQTLQQLAEQNCTHSAIEVGSHALALHRADGLRFTAAALTNITQDHLDFHGTMEAYAAAKARLFTELLEENGTAVLPIQNPLAWPIAAFCRENNIKTLTTGTANAELTVNITKAHSQGLDVTIKYEKETHHTTLPLLGTFQAANIATTLGLGIASGLDFTKMLAALPTLQNVPGRMELVKPQGKIEAAAGRSVSQSQPRLVTVGAGAMPQTQAENHVFQRSVPTVIVDYAHTPDALESATAALKPLLPKNGKLITLFGAGGDRDNSKRPLMAKAAAKHSGHIIITDDNPRSEDPTEIRNQVAAGLPVNFPHNIISPREDAIAAAINMATEHDIVLLAGKGHETGQIINGTTHPFDDRDIARTLLKQK